jgi:hypothetical protein
MNIVTISDTHCGSNVGLMPPKFVRLDEITVDHNPVQEWLWSCWTDLLKRLPRKIDLLILNGDLIEGVHHQTNEIISANTFDHVACAIQALEPIVNRAGRVVIVEGTECHTHSSEHSIARHFDRTTPTKAYPFWLAEVCGVVVSARHHMSCTSRIHLEAGAYSIEMRNEQGENERAGWPIPHLFFRGHRHRGGVFTDGISSIGVSGGWQAITRHGQKAVAGALPMPSAILTQFGSSGQLPDLKLIAYRPPVPQMQLA